jgi:hypothetical protein
MEKVFIYMIMMANVILIFFRIDECKYWTWQSTVTEAVMKQMQEVGYVTPSCVTKVRGELGKKLASITPKV